MRKKALRKDFYMEVRTSLNRFLSIFMIVALGVAFFAGLRATDPDMRITADNYFDLSNLMDIRILSTMGLTDGDVQAIAEVEGVKEVEPSYSTHVVCNVDGNELVLEVLSATERLNQITVSEGRMPRSESEVLVDDFFITSTGYKLGDRISFSSGTKEDIADKLKVKEFTIVGVGSTAYYLSFQRGSSSIGSGDVNSFVVALPEVFKQEAYSSIYVSVENAKEMTVYTDEYDNQVEQVLRRIEEIAQDRCQIRYDDLYNPAHEDILSGRKEVADSTKKLADSRKELEEAREKLLKNEEKLQSSREEIEAANKELTASRKEIEAAKRRLEASKKELKIQRDQLAKAKSRAYEEYQEKLAELKGSGLSKPQLTIALKQLEAAYQGGAEELKQAEIRIAAGETELSAAKTKTKNGEKEIAKAEAKIAEGEKGIRKGEKELTKARTKIADGERELADGERKVKDAERELAKGEEGLSRLELPEWYVLDRSSIEAYVEFEQNADRIGAIGEVFPAFFFLVAALISLTTMTRMVEEERIEIGTLKALGYSKGSIAMKYILYALVATLGGSLFGAMIGQKILPMVIITAYQILYRNIPQIITPYNLYYAGMATALAVLCVELATFFSCYRELHANPANLMRPQAPKAGKRVFIERLPWLWRRLNFTWKATVRNLIRYKKRFFMTVFGIGGCMALLLVGFGLKDSIFVIYTRQFDEIMIYDASLSVNGEAEKEEVEELEEAIEANDQIAASLRVAAGTVDISFQEESKSLTMYIPEDTKAFEDYIVLRERAGHKGLSLDDKGVLITEQVAKKLGVKAGDQLLIKKDQEEVLVSVSGITENYMTHYIYMSPGLYREVFGKEPSYNDYFLLMPGVDQKGELAIGNTLLEHSAASGIFYTSYYQELLSNVLVSLNIVVLVLIISAGALAFVVLYNLNNININERRRELATLKVLGFYNKETAAYVYRENMILTLVGAFVGSIFGNFLHRYVITTIEIDLVMFGRNIDPSSYLYSILLTILFSAFVNLVMYFKLKRINMVESLKSIE